MVSYAVTGVWLEAERQELVSGLKEEWQAKEAALLMRERKADSVTIVKAEIISIETIAFSESYGHYYEKTEHV